MLRLPLNTRKLPLNLVRVNNTSVELAVVEENLRLSTPPRRVSKFLTPDYLDGLNVVPESSPQRTGRVLVELEISSLVSPTLAPPLSLYRMGEDRRCLYVCYWYNRIPRIRSQT